MTLSISMGVRRWWWKFHFCLNCSFLKGWWSGDLTLVLMRTPWEVSLSSNPVALPHKALSSMSWSDFNGGYFFHSSFYSLFLWSSLICFCVWIEIWNWTCSDQVSWHSAHYASKTETVRMVKTWWTYKASLNSRMRIKKSQNICKRRYFPHFFLFVCFCLFIFSLSCALLSGFTQKCPKSQTTWSIHGSSWQRIRRRLISCGCTITSKTSGKALTGWFHLARLHGGHSSQRLGLMIWAVFRESLEVNII